MNFLPFLLFLQLSPLYLCRNAVPLLSLESSVKNHTKQEGTDNENLTYLPFLMMSRLDEGRDTNEFWRETEILSLIKGTELDIDYETCEKSHDKTNNLRIPSSRNVRPVCRTKVDYQLCPQCPHFSNVTECELFKESCRERRVHPSEYRTYCDKKYGPYRAMFIPADYSRCRCCDECVFYRELDQSCVHDEYDFDTEEFLPVTTIDFRAGCNPYWGHPEQDLRALRCDKVLRRCIPVTVPTLPNESLRLRRNFRFEPTPLGADCPVNCNGYQCPSGMMLESQCEVGAFIPYKDYCNCCGHCTSFQQLNQKCAEFKKTVHNMNGSEEIEVEEEFLEPGCDDGLVCREGKCQDIHTVETVRERKKKKREGWNNKPNEPCKRELKFFKKKYGPDGHLHYEAPQCTPLWLYGPIQCRRFACYCALEDGTFIQGIKVPRVEVSNMNCDCAREKCRTGADIECDGYGNYKEVVFTPHSDDSDDEEPGNSKNALQNQLTTN